MRQYGAYCDPAIAAQAVALVLPMLTAAMADRTAGDSGFLHVVIMDPLAPAQADFESAILYEYSLGERSHWDADYAAYARGKARMSWRTGLSGHRLCATAPHLLGPGEQALWGSACIDGVTVGVSGAFAWFDEGFAGAIAHMFIACAKSAQARSA